MLQVQGNIHFLQHFFYFCKEGFLLERTHSSVVSLRLIISYAMSASPPSPPAVLACCPSALRLPTADPVALMTECFLRVSHIVYRKVDGPHDQLQLFFPSEVTDSQLRPAASVKGFDDISHLIHHQEEGRPASSAHLTSSQNEIQTAVRHLSERCLAPAFTFLLYFDPSTYLAEAAPQIDSVVSPSSFFGTLTRATSYRARVLEANPYGGATAAEITKRNPKVITEEGRRYAQNVTSKVLQVFSLIECYCERCSQQEGSNFYFSFRPTPSLLDATLFGACSPFIHANFHHTKKVFPENSLLEDVQVAIRQQCPTLVSYVERVRSMCFTELEGRYALHSLPQQSKPSLPLQPDIYCPGRVRTLLFTAVFTVLYGFLSNITLEASVSDSQEEEGEE